VPPNTSGEPELGYYVPPVATRFRPGVSGNPCGRPPRQKKSIGDTLRDVLAEKITVTVGGRRRKVTNLEAFIRALQHAILKGGARNVRTFARFADRLGQLKVTSR
jgi:hypothetical protein